MPLFMISGDVEGLRAGELSRAVEHTHSNSDVGRLGIGTTCPQAWTHERLETIHCVLGQRTTVVAALPLPFASTALGEGLNSFVAVSRGGGGRRPVNCASLRGGMGSIASRMAIVAQQSCVSHAPSMGSTGPSACHSSQST